MIVRYDPLPIPDHRFDWMAYEDEETGLYGYGRTRDEAIANYFDICETLVDAGVIDDCPAEPLYDKRAGL